MQRPLHFTQVPVRAAHAHTQHAKHPALLFSGVLCLRVQLHAIMLRTGETCSISHSPAASNNSKHTHEAQVPAQPPAPPLLLRLRHKAAAATLKASTAALKTLGCCIARRHSAWVTVLPPPSSISQNRFLMACKRIAVLIYRVGVRSSAPSTVNKL